MNFQGILPLILLACLAMLFMGNGTVTEGMSPGTLVDLLSSRPYYHIFDTRYAYTYPLSSRIRPYKFGYPYYGLYSPKFYPDWLRSYYWRYYH